MTELCAVLLAGGRSQRMGRDKATIEWDGELAVHRLARVAREAGAKDVVVSGEDYGLPFVRDPVRHGGPLGGFLAAAAARPDARRFLVLAVDAPTLSSHDLAVLIRAADPGAAFVGFPLPMCVASAAIPQALEAGAPLRRLVDLAGLAQIAPTAEMMTRLRGANTPQDLDVLRDEKHLEVCVNDTRLFEFESDFVASLRCVPMAVRFKLDRSGIKLSLRQWNRFTQDDRRSLLMRPCHTPQEVEAYRLHLVALVAARSGSEAMPLPAPPQPLWDQLEATPPAVLAFANQAGVAAPTSREWSRLTRLERFTLIKLSRDNHDNVNFVPAMREFGLVAAEVSTPTARRAGVVTRPFEAMG